MLYGAKLFTHLFQSELHEFDESILDSVKVKVTPDMNRSLLAPFTTEEVKKVLFNIGDLKALGPDGLHAIFFKRFWSMLGDDLTKEVFSSSEHKKNSRGLEWHHYCYDSKGG